MRSKKVFQKIIFGLYSASYRTQTDECRCQSQNPPLLIELTLLQAFQLSFRNILEQTIDI